MSLSVGSASWLPTTPLSAGCLTPPAHLPLPGLCSLLCFLFAINLIHDSPAGPCHPAQGRLYISAMSQAAVAAAMDGRERAQAARTQQEVGLRVKAELM